MRGAAVPRDRSQLRTLSGKEPLRGCKAKGKLDNVIVIDVECDKVPNVIIIDAPEPWQKRSHSSNESGGDKKFPFEGVISIDDEEDSDVNPTGIGVECHTNFDSNATSGKKSCNASGSAHNTGSPVGEKGRVLRENISLNSSKRKQAYSAKVPSRNRYGLDSESESGSDSGSSDSDCSDCELIDGSFDTIREQWEQASLKRRNEVHKDRSGMVDQASAFGTSDSNLHDIASNSRTGSPVESDENADHESFRCGPTEKTKSAFFGTSESNFGGSASHSRVGSSFVQSEKNVDHDSFLFRPARKTVYSLRKTDVKFWGERSVEDPPFSYAKRQSNKNLNCSTDSSNDTEQSSQGPLCSNEENGESSMSGYSQPDKKQADSGEAVFKRKAKSVPEEFYFCSTSIHNLPEVSDEVAGFQETEKLDSEELHVRNTTCNQPQIKRKEPFVASVSNSGSPDKQDVVHAQDGDVMPSIHTDIINEREKLKETDEYKRAIEEEWASRQHELKIQAEEAQRLKKRKKAETLRLLDMERRQKQRVEEVRETQKKDEEYMNLKEQLRVEIREKLHILEVTSINMASLLRGLGIHVEGGFQPASSEVHAAYKRALLKFHPDRASRTDIRQQVEAEEKFKLISRMKEKFLS